MKYHLFIGIIAGLLLALAACDTEKQGSDSSSAASENAEAVVSNPTGLSIFASSSYESRKVIKIVHQERITLLEDTKKADEINGVKGTWFKVKHKNIEGYAFSGFFEIISGSPARPKTDSPEPAPENDNPLLRALKGNVFVRNNNAQDCELIPMGGYGFIVFQADGTLYEYAGTEGGNVFLSRGRYEVKEKQVIIFPEKEIINSFDRSQPFSTKPLYYELQTCKKQQVLENSKNREFATMYLEKGKNAYQDAIRTVERSQHAAKYFPESLQPEQAQNYLPPDGRYRSQEGGVEETIRLRELGDTYEVYYKSPKYRQEVKLNVYNAETGYRECEVSFPNEANVRYKMRFQGKAATCTYPNGKVQVFRKID